MRAIAAVLIAGGIGASFRDLPDRTAFVGVTVLPMSADTLLSDQTVLVEGGVVSRVGRRTEVTVPRGAHVVRGHGRVLMPGLADMHVHLEEADLSRHLRAGVTLVRNMRGEPRHLQWREDIKAGRRSGPRIITSGPTLTGAVRMNPRHVSITSGAEVSAEVRAQAAAGYDLVKVHSGLSARLLGLIGAVAESTHRAVVGHLMEGGLEAAVASRQASIEHVDPRVWASVSADTGMKRLTAAGTFFCPTFTAFYDGAPDSALGRDSVRPSARHRALALAAGRNQVLVLAGTDASLPPREPGAALVAELRYMAAAGMGPYNALRTATANAGEFVRRHVPRLPRLGVVEAGSAADLILLPADPRSDLGVLSEVQGVMVGGRWLELRETIP